MNIKTKSLLGVAAVCTLGVLGTLALAAKMKNDKWELDIATWTAKCNATFDEAKADRTAIDENAKNGSRPYSNIADFNALVLERRFTRERRKRGLPLSPETDTMNVLADTHHEFDKAGRIVTSNEIAFRNGSYSNCRVTKDLQAQAREEELIQRAIWDGYTAVYVISGAADRDWTLPKNAITAISCNGDNTALRLDWGGHSFVFFGPDLCQLAGWFMDGAVECIAVPTPDPTKRLVTSMEYFEDATDPRIATRMSARSLE